MTFRPSRETSSRGCLQLATRGWDCLPSGRMNFTDCSVMRQLRAFWWGSTPSRSTTTFCARQCVWDTMLNTLGNACLPISTMLPQPPTTCCLNSDTNRDSRASLTLIPAGLIPPSLPTTIITVAAPLPIHNKDPGNAPVSINFWKLSCRRHLVSKSRERDRSEMGRGDMQSFMIWRRAGVQGRT